MSMVQQTYNAANRKICRHREPRPHSHRGVSRPGGGRGHGLTPAPSSSALPLPLSSLYSLSLSLFFLPSSFVSFSRLSPVPLCCDFCFSRDRFRCDADFRHVGGSNAISRAPRGIQIAVRRLTWPSRPGGRLHRACMLEGLAFAPRGCSARLAMFQRLWCLRQMRPSSPRSSKADSPRAACRFVQRMLALAAEAS